MTTKAKMKEQDAPVLYDASATQTIPLDVRQNGKTYTVRHQLTPLTNERYFVFKEAEEKVEKHALAKKKISTDLAGPKEALWSELAESVEGYKPRDDFKSGVHHTHKIEAINALTSIQLIEPETESEDEFFDIDRLVTVPFRAMFSGVLLCDLSISFKPESKADVDRFLELGLNQPNEKALASAAKLSSVERLYELGRGLIAEYSGYEGEPPAWHVAPAVESFFISQIAQAGKG